METFLLSFLGCMLALELQKIVDLITKPKKAETPKVVYKREAPKNIGRFADPLGEYEAYKDVKTHLYKTYVPKKANRRGGNIDE